MIYDLTKFEDEVKKGNLRKVEDEDLVLYNYTDKCTYDKAWNEITTMSRGIIFDKASGELVAKPFPKFFNLGEREETMIKNLPNEPYAVTEKYDGSLGIVFNYKGKWRVATRGSLNSEQAQKAQEMLHCYDMEKVSTELTLLVEIIYPENKIIVNYGTAKTLVLLGAYDTLTENELLSGRPPASLGLGDIISATGLEPAKSYRYSIEGMIALQKTLTKDSEGFVVRFYGGLRIKIKGEEYMKIAKMISTMSPLSFWESMENGIVKKEYLQQLPEEFRNDFEPLVTELELQYARMIDQIRTDVDNIPKSWSRKEIGLSIHNNEINYQHPNAVFPYLQGKVEKYIMKQIRPTGNVLRNEL